MNKKHVVVSQSTKKALKDNSSKKEVSEHTLRLNQLEDDMRSLYDQTDQMIEEIKKEQEKVVEEEVVIEEEPGVLITDAAFRNREDEVVPRKRRIGALGIIAIILSVIFILLLIAFIAFLIYVCTY